MEGDKGFDLYGDLDSFDLGEKLRLKEKSLKELQIKFEEQTQKYNQLETAKAKITKQLKNLQKNFHSLLLTAKSEIERKNRRIETLSTEIDNLCFRRGRNQENLNQRPSHQPEATTTREYQSHPTNPQKPVESYIRNPFRHNEAKSRKETPTYTSQVAHHTRQIEKSKDRHIIVKVSGSETTQLNDTANDGRILKPIRDAVTVDKNSDIDRRLKEIRKSTETLNLKPTVQKSSKNIDANKNILNLNPPPVKIKRTKREKESKDLIEEVVITKNVQAAKADEPEEVKDSIVLKESLSCSQESQNEISKTIKLSPEEIINKEVEVSNVNNEIIDPAIEKDSKQMLPKTSLQEVQKTSLELKETNEEKLRTEEIRAFEDILFDEMVFGGVSTASDDADKTNSDLYENLDVEEIQNTTGNREDTEAVKFLVEKYMQPPDENCKNPVLPSVVNESQNMSAKTDSNLPVEDDTITVADLIGAGSTTEDIMENPQQEISTNVKKFLTDFPVEYALFCSTSLVNKPTNQWQPSKTIAMESLFGITPVKVTKKFKRLKGSTIQMKKENTDDPNQENLTRRTKKETEMISIDPQTLEELSELQNGNHCDSNTSPTDSEVRKSKRHQGSSKKSSKLVGHKIEGFEPKHLRIESLAESSRVLKNALFEEVLSNFDSSSVGQVRDKTADESGLNETPRSDESLELNLTKINPVNVEEERIAEIAGGEDSRADESNQNLVPDLTGFVENVIDGRSDNLEKECLKNSTEIISKTEDDLERDVISKLPKIGEMRHENKKNTFSHQNTTDEAKNRKSAKTQSNSMMNLAPEKNFENKLEVGGIKLIADEPKLRSDDNNRKEEAIGGSKTEKLAKNSKKDSKKAKKENKSEVKSKATVKSYEEMNFVRSDFSSVQENKKDEPKFSRKSDKKLGSIETELKKSDLDQCLSRNSPFDLKSSQTMPKNLEFDQNSDFENNIKKGEIADESKLRSSDDNKKQKVVSSSKFEKLAENSKKDSKKAKSENKFEIKSDAIVKNSEDVNFVSPVQENKKDEPEFSRKSEKNLRSIKIELRESDLDQCLSGNLPFDLKSCQNARVQIKKLQFDQNLGQFKCTDSGLSLKTDQSKSTNSELGLKSDQVPIVGQKRKLLDHDSHRRNIKEPRIESHSFVKSDHIESYAESYKTKDHSKENHYSSTERCSTSKTEEFKETPVNKSKISHSGSEKPDRKRTKVDQPTTSKVAELTKDELKKSHPKVHSIKDILDENATDEELFDKVFKSPNKYSCVAANPLNLSDPSGMDERFKQIEEDIKKLCTSPEVECSDVKRVSKIEENENNLEVIQQHPLEASNVDIFQQQTDHPPVNRDKLNTSETEPLNVSNKSDHNNVSGDSMASLNDSCKIMTTSSKIFRIEIIDSNVTNIFITRRKSKKKKMVS